MRIFIDKKEYNLEKEILTINQALVELDLIPIAGICLHPALSFNKSCKFCLVKVMDSGGKYKLLPACSTLVKDKMSIEVYTEEAIEIRKNLIEIIANNHPLECPLCEKIGDCKLQDIMFEYDAKSLNVNSEGKFLHTKDIDYLVSCKMTRCINCMLCVKFCEEITGKKEFISVNNANTVVNGEEFFPSISRSSNIIANVIDICPVGALVPFSGEKGVFHAGDLIYTSSVDIMDPILPSVKVGAFEDAVKSVVPEYNKDLNGYWIGDKSRYIFDANDVNRIETPWIRKNDTLVPATWEEAYEEIVSHIVNLSKDDVAGLIGDFVDLETMYLLKKLFIFFDYKHLDAKPIDFYANKQLERGDYLFNSGIQGIEESDAILIVGSNLYNETPTLVVKIREALTKNHKDIFLIGDDCKFSFPYTYLGDNEEALSGILAPDNGIARAFAKAKKPMVIVGEAIFRHKQAESIFNVIKLFSEKYEVVNKDWNGYNVILNNLSVVNASILEINPSINYGINSILSKIDNLYIKLLWLFNVDNLDTERLKNTFVIYQGSFGNDLAEVANVILPSATYFESDASYANIEGRVLHTSCTINAPRLVKENWKIVFELAEKMGCTFHYRDLGELREYMEKEHSAIAYNGKIRHNLPIAPSSNNGQELKNTKISSIFDSYYNSNIFTKHSKAMTMCYDLFLSQKKGGKND